VPGTFEKVLRFSAFFGVQKILDLQFLFFASQVAQVCSLEGKHDIFEVISISLVPFTVYSLSLTPAAAGQGDLRGREGQGAGELYSRHPEGTSLWSPYLTC